MINEALKVYLGADEKGGFNPIGCEERFARAYPVDHPEKKKMIQRYLEEDYAPDWSKDDLVQAGEVFANILKKKFPELDAVAIRALANRFCYDWR